MGITSLKHDHMVSQELVVSLVYQKIDQARVYIHVYTCQVVTVVFGAILKAPT